MTPAEIKAARQAASLTQREAAALVGVDIRSWQKWEYGERAMPVMAWRLFKMLTEEK